MAYRLIKQYLEDTIQYNTYLTGFVVGKEISSAFSTI